ncbi:MAG: NUDIX domain-containing protein [Candidatus Nanoarchaeia archaeon]
MPTSHLPYRPNVSMVTFKDDKFLLVCLKNWEENWWKFPQGGIDEGETPEQAAIREFKEELGTDKVRIKGISKHSNRYDWPVETVLKYNREFRGQDQVFVLLEFLGEDHDIKLNPNEVQMHKWASKEEVLKYAADPDHCHFWSYNGNISKILDEFNL